MRWIAAIAALALAAVACAPATAPAQAPDPTPSPGWERRIAPFVIEDATGEPYEFPFLGGFNVPRPRFVDIDADADLDLFVQERVGDVMFFENVGSAADPEYKWRTDDYRGLNIGTWYRFADLDDDGDQDLFAEQPYGYIRFYRNVGTPRHAEFTLAVDSLEDLDGEEIFSDRQNIPKLVDIDCDGRLDLFLGRLDGTITRYEQAGPGPDGNPRFRLVEDEFEGIRIITGIQRPGRPNIPGAGGIVPNIPGAGAGTGPTLRHGANSMSFADADNDGDADLLWGDFFTPRVLWIENTGSCRAPEFPDAERPLPAAARVATSGYNVPEVADFGADGDNDLFIGVLGGAFNPNKTAAENFYFLERTESGALELRTRRFLDGLDVGAQSSPAFADTDGDGDLDLYVGNKIDPAALDAARLYRFENVGTPTSPRYTLADTLALSDSYNQAPEFGDLNDDGDPDLLLGSWNSGIAYYRGTDSGLALVDSALVRLERASHTVPALGDLDGDGDLDLVVGETAGTLSFFRNVGGASAPEFRLVSDEFLGADVGRRSAPALADIDADRDLDLIVGSETGGATLYRNEGTPGAPEFVREPRFGPPLPPYSAPTFADLDGDGRLELVSGTRAGGLGFWERR